MDQIGRPSSTRFTERDRKEIIDLIEAETVAYMEKDFEAWARCWTHLPETRRFQASVADGMRVDVGWREFGATMKDRLARNPEPNVSHTKISRTNMNITIGSDMAWATFDQVGVETGDEFDLAGVQHELRVLHKIEGNWKIACMMVMQRSIDHARHPLIEIDKSMQILWMNGEAKTRLPGFPGLIISAGHLRAKEKEHDANLKAAVSRVHRLNDKRITFIPKGNGAIPVVLAEDDYGAPKHCWVSLRDNKVVVSFDDDKLVEQKVSWARQVYHLSSMQSQIVCLLIEGRDIANIANDLGITVNTVRTHLQRMYDKTGARSRHALVCAILNMEPPIS